MRAALLLLGIIGGACGVGASSSQAFYSLTTSSVVNGSTPQTIGVNQGHNWDASTYVYMRRLGVNSALF